LPDSPVPGDTDIILCPDSRKCGKDAGRLRVMNNSRKLKLDKDYTPFPSYEGDEIYPNGIFNFNISRILEHIMAGKLDVEKELININEWFKTHFRDGQWIFTNF
jgi:hypothetical protein